MNKMQFRLLLLFLFVIAFGLINKPITVQAVATPTKEEVFKNAPDGLNLRDVIEHPDYKKGTNDAKLNTDFPVNIVEMITKDGGQDQISSFWGKKYKNNNNGDVDSNLYNYFDLTKDQTISAWIYTGDVYHNYPEYSSGEKINTYKNTMETDKTPDGLAMVLQNDDNGAQAISTAIGGDNAGAPSYGETLGVWGGSTVDHSPLTASNRSLIPMQYPDENLYKGKLQNGAIQNSFAVELDPLQNFTTPSLKTYNILFQTISGKDDYFDIENDYKGQHITIGYPGDSSTYNDFSNMYSTTNIDWLRGYWFSQAYHNGTSNNIQLSGYASSNADDMNIDKAWKHFTFKYKASDSSFTYAFNDQERDGKAKPLYYRSSSSGTIDTSKLGNSKHIRWGFTASTGSQNSAPNDFAIIMQQMPSTANVQSSIKLTDMSQYNSDGNLGRDISNLDENKSFDPSRPNPLSLFKNNPKYNVSNNDKLRLQYNLNYESGTLDTGDINTNIKLPENINFTPGISSSIGDQSIGEVVYNNIDGAVSYEISTGDITQDQDGNNIINLNLANMDSDINGEKNQKITVYLYGRANASTTPQLVNGTPVSYRSNNYIEDVTSPTFIINDQLQIATTAEDKTVSLDEDAVIDGNMSYVNKSNFDGKDMVLHTSINGTDLDNTNIETTSGNSTTNYKMIATNAAATGSLLKIGKNKIEVYATDSMNRVSNTITYTVTVKDYKNLVLTSTSDDPMTVKITDPIQLDAEAKYDNKETIDKLSTLTSHIKIDNGEFETVSISKGDFIDDIATFSIKLVAGKLNVGQHTVYMYIDDGIRNSNIVEYHINVISKNLVLIADNTDKDQTVYDNGDVKLNGNYAYDDDSNFLNKITSIKYQITNADGTKQDTVSKNVTSTIENNAKFTINLSPIGTKLIENGVNQSVDEYLKTATGLKVGKNEISVTAYDGDDAISNTETYVVNVPEISPSISTNNQEITSIAQMKINLPLTFTYPDANDQKYLLQASDLVMFATIKDSNDNPTTTLIDQPQSSEGKVKTPYQLNSKSNWVQNLTSGKNNLSVYVMDRYLRKSNTLDYQLNVLPQGTMVEVENYRFKDIDPKENIDDYIKRDGGWNVKVNSYQDKWNLNAYSKKMLHQDNDGNYTQLSNLELVNLTSGDSNPISLSQNPVVASGDSRTSVAPVLYNIFGENSDANKGIMLRTNGVPLQGEYQSTILWSIDDSI